jgi:hypothetical protein
MQTEPDEFTIPEMFADSAPAAEALPEEPLFTDAADMEEADAMATLMAEEFREQDQQAEDTLDEEAEPVFDIMQLLAAEAEKLANVSPIDMMDTYGELVIDITLEELVHYNKAQRSKRGMR